MGAGLLPQFRDSSQVPHAKTMVYEPASATVIGMDTLERETRNEIAEAMAIIDKNLVVLVQRELVSCAEMTDLLLDVRSLLVASTQN